MNFNSIKFLDLYDYPFLMISIKMNLYTSPPFYPDEILCLLDENEKHWISQFEENQEKIMNMYSSDDDLPF